MLLHITTPQVARFRRWLRTWPAARWWILFVASLVMLGALAAASAFWAGGGQVGIWWLLPAIFLSSASFGGGVAAVAGARGSRAATLCDLRPLFVAFVASCIAVTPLDGGGVTTAILSSLGPWGAVAGQAVLALVGVLAQLVTLRDRMDAELAASPQGEDCPTCVPLPPLTGPRRG